MNLSPRDRWVVAFLPALATIAGFVYGPMKTAESRVEEAKKRLADAEKAPARPAAAPKAPDRRPELKAELAAAKKAADDAVAHLRNLEARLRDAEHGAAAPVRPVRHKDPPAVVQGRIDRILRSAGLEPVSGSHVAPPKGVVPALAALSGLPPGATANAATLPTTVWQSELIGRSDALHKALAELVRTEPGVVPVGLDASLNRDDDGETRRLTLWLLY